jgi:hypothetical protein
MKKISTLLVRKAEGSGDSWMPTGKNWIDSLTRVSHMLDGIIKNSEGEFLAIGEKLQEFYSSAQEMCTKSGSVVEIMTGEGLSRATDGLTTILDELKEHLEESERHFDKITGAFEEHLKALGRVSSHLEDLDMLVLNLSMLGFLTRVENAHIYTHNSGFASLTDDVRRLSENIKQKSSRIRAVSDNVRGFITLAMSKVADFEKTQSDSARTTHRHAVANHYSLSKKNESASESARLIEQKSKEIASSIGNIIMSMQFHDITRQQIEHVKEVLDHLCERIGAGGQDGSENVAMVRDILTLQRAQLEQSEDDLVNAVFQIIENLHAISKSTNQILSETNDVAWASETAGSSFMDDLDHGISSVIECIKLTAEEQSKLTGTVSSASEMVSEMSVFVQDIETLGLNLQLIALNARIKAAHLGREGAALDTISGSIYELSRNARQDTKTLTEILAGLVELSLGFKKDLISMQDKQSQMVALMVDKLKELIASLHQINDKVLTILTGMTTLGESLSKDIRTTADGIAVHEDVKNMLDDVMAVIEETAENARRICPAGNNAAAGSFLADIDKLYTMKSERDIHLQHFDAFPAGNDPKAMNTHDDLGDNVELF